MSVTEVAVVGKLKDATVPVEAVKYCKQPGGPPISSVHVYCNAYNGKEGLASETWIDQDCLELTFTL